MRRMETSYTKMCTVYRQRASKIVLTTGLARAELARDDVRELEPSTQLYSEG